MLSKYVNYVKFQIYPFITSNFPFSDEMRSRREFYEKHPDEKHAVPAEARGESAESHIFSPDESLNLSLEYYCPSVKSENQDSNSDAEGKSLPRRYLRCPAAVTVFHLQKLIRAKYGLTDAHRVDILYQEEALRSTYSLMDIMYIYLWRRVSFLYYLMTP